MASQRQQRRNADDRRARFVASYLVCLNARQAAIEAGYSEKSASAQGSRLLTDAKVTEMIEKAKSAALVTAEINQNRVLTELSRLAFSDVSDYAIDDAGNLIPAPGRSVDVMKAVSAIKRRVRIDTEGNVEREVEFRLWDKPGSLKLAGRHVGLFPGKDQAAIEAAAEIYVTKLIEKARQEKEAQRALAENREADRERTVDVVEVVPAPKTEGGGTP